MTEVKTFRAPNMQAALELVRGEMGGDAVILHTRQIPVRRLIPWGKQKEEVEITAGLGVPTRTPANNRRPTAVLDDAFSRRQTNEKTLNRQPTFAIQGQQKSSTIRSELPGTSHTTPGGLGHTTGRPSEDSSTSSPSQALARDATANAKPKLASAPVAKPPIGKTTPTKFSPPEYSPAGDKTQTHDKPTSDPNVVFANKLDTLQKMIEDLARSTSKRASAEIPAEMFQLYTQLIDADVDDELAKELIFRLPQYDRANPADLQAAKATLTALVASEIHCGPAVTPNRNGRKVVALVGPTGVGKTTTIAKLAANFRLRDNIRMGLVTVDTYRIAAVEQLRTYAEIIDLPMKVVTSPPEMRRALDELAGLELVLIDTGGRSPRDELKIQELKSLLGEAEVDEVHLVLGLNASLRSLESAVELFRPVGVSSLLLSKLDEAPSLGTILSLSRKFPWPISYVTTGQDVPDDIEPAHPDRLARLILGQDRLTT